MTSHPSRLERQHPFRQWKTWTMPNTQLTLTGYSRANDKTFFHVPELRCCFDAGLCEGRQPELVFLTHTHADHSKDLDFLASRVGGVDIYAPAAALDYIHTSIRASRELNFMAPFDPSLAGEMRLHGVRGGDRFTVGKRGSHAVRVIDCEHKITCVGYGISEVKRRRLPAFEGQTGAELAHHRRAGTEIDEPVEHPLFAFIGDTHARIFESTPSIFDFPVVITECTYLEDVPAERDRAERNGHTHWVDLQPVIAAHPDTTFVLIHFSLRYSDAEVIAFFDALELPNVVVWAHPNSILPEQHR